MQDREEHVVDFYRRHPISADHILAKLKSDRGDLNNVRPEELYPHDQDHYGGLDANEALASATRMGAGKKIADFCAGLAGPARYWAVRYGVEVTGIELTANRTEGANQLTRLVGLEAQVRVLQGDVLNCSLPSEGFDAVVSQEAFLHVPDKSKAIGQAFRILKSGGRLAYSDWIIHRPLQDADAEEMWQGIAAQTLQTISGYKILLSDAGFVGIAAEDQTAAWADILEKRLAMYTELREEARRTGSPSGDDKFYHSYRRLVDLVKERTLGGVRISAEKPA